MANFILGQKQYQDIQNLYDPQSKRGLDILNSFISVIHEQFLSSVERNKNYCPIYRKLEDIPDIDLSKIKDFSLFINEYIYSYKDIKKIHDYLLKENSFNLLVSISKSIQDNLEGDNIGKSINKSRYFQVPTLSIFAKALKDQDLSINPSNLSLWKNLIENDDLRGTNAINAKLDIMNKLFFKIHKGWVDKKWFMKNLTDICEEQHNFTTSSLMRIERLLEDIHKSTLKIDHFCEPGTVLDSLSKKNRVVVEEDCMGFHWKVDTVQFSRNNNINFSKLRENLKSSLFFLKENVWGEPSVIFQQIQNTSYHTTLDCLHRDEKLFKQIREYLNFTLDKCKENNALEEKDFKAIWNNVLFHSKLENTLEQSNLEKRTLKI